jgi:hypothetical protein
MKMDSQLPQHIKDKARNFTLTKDDFGDEETFNLDEFVTVCKNYPWFFIEQFQRVRNVQGRFQPARLNRAQRYMEKVRMEQLQWYPFVHLIVLKIRQTGLSWICARWELWAAIFYNFYCDILASAKDDVAMATIFNYVLEGLSDLREQAQTHRFLQPYLITDIERNDKLKFTGFAHDGGRIEALAASKQAVSRSAQFAHFTEVSRMGNWTELWNSYSPSLHLETHHYCILESTALYSGAHFMDMYREARDMGRDSQKPPPMRAVFIPVYLNDNYVNFPMPESYTLDHFMEDGKYSDGKPKEDLYGLEEDLMKREWYDPLDEKHIKLPLRFWYWRRMKIQQMKDDKSLGFTKLQMFQQDYPMDEDEAELIAGENAFPRTIMLKRKRMVTKSIFRGDIKINEKREIKEEPNDFKGIYQRWDWVKDGLKYFIGIDPSNSREGDRSVSVVYSPFQNAFVAMLMSNNISVHDLVEKSIAMAMYWNNAMIAYEINLTAIGETMKRKFLGTDIQNPNGSPYKNLYKRKPVNTSWTKISTNPVLGFQLDATRKNSIRQLWYDALSDDDSGIFSEELVNELWNWRQDVKNLDGDLQVTCSAPRGKHDDIIIAGGIAMYCSREAVWRTDMLQQNSEYDKNFATIIKGLDKDIGRDVKSRGNVNLWDRYIQNRKNGGGGR